MMKGISQLVYGLAALAAVTASPVEKRGPHAPYHGAQVVRVNLANKKEVSQLQNIVSGLKLDVWSPKYKPGGTVDVVIPPGKRHTFSEAAGSLHTSLMHENLGLAIAQEAQYQTYTTGSALNSTWFESYHPYDDHIKWINDLQAAFPRNSKIIKAPGKTFEGRDIVGIKIWGANNKEGDKPAAVFHGNVHAREWITSMTVEYLAYQLLTSGANELKDLEFHIFPLVNPDGFIYTQTGDRMWRKNRMTDGRCGKTKGTDINRNWPFMWNKGGSSSICSSDAYMGERAGNSPENIALREYMKNITKKTLLYIDVHSYSQLLMSPYGYTCDKSALPKNNARIQQVLGGWEGAISKRYGTRFEYGPICTTIYQASGSSSDWFAAEIGVPYSLAVELRDKGNKGFLLPANQIKPSGDEMWDGMQYLVREILKDGGGAEEPPVGIWPIEG